MFQNNYKNPKTLGTLYWKEKLSLIQISKKFGVTRQTIQYWMKKNSIPLRPPKLEFKIPKKMLERLYLKNKLSTLQIARKLGIKSRETVRQKLITFGISRRSRLEAITKYKKESFSQSPNEKAYMIGLRSGDLSAHENHKQIRVSTTTTHIAQLNMIKEVFGKYSHVHTYIATYKGRKEWQTYCDLDRSFDFLLEKPDKIPQWILENNSYFFSFLSGYSDSEGCWSISKAGKGFIAFTFNLASCDKGVLNQIRDKFEEMDLRTYFYLKRRKGYINNFGKLNKNFYILSIGRKTDTINLANRLIKLSHHNEKICKMKLLLEIKNNKKWNDVKDKILKLRMTIKDAKIGTEQKLS